jgi:lysozyme
MTQVYGKDYSRVQAAGHEIDWVAEAQSGVRFAYHKAGNGNDGSDDAFMKDVGGARAAGIACGAYGFYYDLPFDANATRAPAWQAQAHYMAAQGVGSNPGDMPPAGDLEWPPPDQWQRWGVTADMARNNGALYMAVLQRLFGVSPLLYTYRYFWGSAGLNAEKDTRFAAYPLWLAGVGAPGDIVKPLGPWAGWTIYQSGGTGLCHLKTNGPVPVDEDWIASEEIFLALKHY